MAKKILKCWKQSKTDKNWWFIPKKYPTPTSPAERTLTIHQNKISKRYWVGTAGPLLSNYKGLKKTKDKKIATKFAKSYMKKHDVCKL